MKSAGRISRHGYHPGALLAEPQAWLKLIHAEDMPAINQEIAALLGSEHELVDIEFRIMKADVDIA